jgi:hypothetical protein
MRKRYALAVAYALWALEWLFRWSRYLGSVGHVVFFLWLFGLGYLVIETRMGRLNRRLHTCLWMSSLLVITVIRVLSLGRDGGWFASVARVLPMPQTELARSNPELMSVLAASTVGVVAGLAGALEAAIIGVMSWIGDSLRPGDEDCRVPFAAPVAVIVLQAPTFLVVMHAGLSLFGGGVAQAAILPIGAGLVLWALAVIHLDRLLALARGHWLTRFVLTLYAVAGALVLFLGPCTSIGRGVATAFWLGLQLWAIRASRRPRARSLAARSAR